MVAFKSDTTNIHSSKGIASFLNWLRNIYGSSEVKKQFMVHPCQINGQATLVYERDLELSDPEAYRHLCAYAAQNGFKIKEDRRQDFIEGIKRVKDKQSANVMTIMVLTGCLLSPKAFADLSGGSEALSRTGDHMVEKTSQTLVNDDLLELNMSFSDEMTETELMVALLRWINRNSSFDHNLDDLPRIEKVDKYNIAKIAFGGTLPAAMDPDSYGIKGLYNFNNKTIYILDNLDMSNGSDRAILLHELVHFLQYQYGDEKGVECKNELERLAYRLEAKFLSSTKNKINFNMSHIENVSRCT